MLIKRSFLAVQKVDLTILAALAVEAAFMNQVMMEPAELYEVLETRFTAVGPVFDVMTVDKLVICTPRETATTVSGPQSTTHGRWNGS